MTKDTRLSCRTMTSATENEEHALYGRCTIVFGACYAYSPHGTCEASKRSRLVCARIKSGNGRWLRRYAARVRELAGTDTRFDDLFREAVLIPIPPSTPMRASATCDLAIALYAAGLAASVWPGLSRRSAVKRSAAAWRWERTTVEEHFRSLSVGCLPTTPARITLIDDVVTKGRTTMAAALRLRAAFPRTRICAFALIRTMGFVPDLRQVVAPCLGTIRWNGRDACREP
jgi:hypothetical protein